MKIPMPHALVVDDDEHILLFASTVLTSVGYKVVQAPNALEALALLDGKTKFDLLVTDLRMPFMDGSGLVSLVRQENPKLPIVIVSAYLPEMDNHDFFPKDMVVLRKPFAYQQLVDGVKQAAVIV